MNLTQGFAVYTFVSYNSPMPSELIQTVTIPSGVATTLSSLITLPTGASSRVGRITVQIDSTAANGFRLGNSQGTSSQPSVSATVGLEFLLTGTRIHTMQGQRAVDGLDLADYSVWGVGGASKATFAIQLAY